MPFIFGVSDQRALVAILNFNYGRIFQPSKKYERLKINWNLRNNVFLQINFVQKLNEVTNVTAPFRAFFIHVNLMLLAYTKIFDIDREKRKLNF